MSKSTFCDDLVSKCTGQIKNMNEIKDCKDKFLDYQQCIKTLDRNKQKIIFLKSLTKCDKSECCS